MKKMLTVALLVCGLLCTKGAWCQEVALTNTRAIGQDAGTLFGYTSYYTASVETKSNLALSTNLASESMWLAPEATENPEHKKPIFSSIKYSAYSVILREVAFPYFSDAPINEVPVTFSIIATALPLNSTMHKPQPLQMQPLLIDPVQASFSLYLSPCSQRPHFFRIQNSIGKMVQSLSGRQAPATAKVPQWENDL